MTINHTIRHWWVPVAQLFRPQVVAVVSIVSSIKHPRRGSNRARLGFLVAAAVAVLLLQGTLQVMVPTDPFPRRRVVPFRLLGYVGSSEIPILDEIVVFLLGVRPQIGLDPFPGLHVRELDGPSFQERPGVLLLQRDPGRFDSQSPDLLQHLLLFPPR
jgi:hypothetical protein